MKRAKITGTSVSCKTSGTARTPAAYRRGVEAEVQDSTGEWHDPENHTYHRGEEDAHDDTAPEAPGYEREREGKPEQGEQDRPLRKVAQSQVRDRVRYHDAAVLQADKSNKQTDADGDRQLQRKRDRVKDGLTQPREDQNGHHDAFHDHGGHRLLPGEAETQDQGVRHDRVEAEPRSQRDREVRRYPHRDAGRRCRDAGCEKHALRREPRALCTEDRRVDEDDVGHRHKSRQPRDHLRPKVRPPFRKLEENAHKPFSQSRPLHLANIATLDAPLPAFSTISASRRVYSVLREVNKEGGAAVEVKDVVSRDPEVVHGALVFAGTRVFVEALVDYVAGGHSLDEFLDDFPTVSREQAIAYLKMTPKAMDALAAGREPAA